MYDTKCVVFRDLLRNFNFIQNTSNPFSVLFFFKKGFFRFECSYFMTKNVFWNLPLVHKRTFLIAPTLPIFDDLGAVYKPRRQVRDLFCITEGA